MDSILFFRVAFFWFHFAFLLAMDAFKNFFKINTTENLVPWSCLVFNSLRVIKF